MKRRRFIVLHCTATPEGRVITPDDIVRWHIKERGWDRVGYSKLILLDGSVHSFVDEDDDDFVDPWEVTYGAAGWNSVCLHICYVGGLDKYLKPKNTMNKAQEIAVVEIVKKLQNKWNIPLIGHNQLTPKKACPSFYVPKWVKDRGYDILTTNFKAY